MPDKVSELIAELREKRAKASNIALNSITVDSLFAELMVAQWSK